MPALAPQTRGPTLDALRRSSAGYPMVYLREARHSTTPRSAGSKAGAQGTMAAARWSGRGRQGRAATGHNRAMTTLYGIPNCDTVKRAREWLARHGVAYEFHDFKKHGVPADRLRAWVDAAGWEGLLNRRGTTWRGLDAARQAAVIDAASAQGLMREEPSTIRRPVVEWDDGRVTVGFDADAWAAAAR
jgi:Spx/MgsR family transcriptional regulator